jgi:hypothetical protein
MREGSLKFGTKVTAANDVAEQFFCEKKVETKYLHEKLRP